MTNLYDNGEILLGTKKDILKFEDVAIKKGWIDAEDYKEIKETLEDLTEDTIVAINYDHGMGLSFDWWDKSHIIKNML